MIGSIENKTLATQEGYPIFSNGHIEDAKNQIGLRAYNGLVKLRQHRRDLEALGIATWGTLGGRGRQPSLRLQGRSQLLPTERRPAQGSRGSLLLLLLRCTAIALGRGERTGASGQGRCRHGNSRWKQRVRMRAVRGRIRAFLQWHSERGGGESNAVQEGRDWLANVRNGEGLIS